MQVTATRRSRRRARRPGRAWSRARTVVGTVVLAAVAGFAFVTVVLPLLMGAQTYTVLTGSMEPGMPPGTLIAVRPAAIDEVRVGQVVTYQIRSGDPAVVTHRVVGTTSSTNGGRLLLTRGDANDADDPPVQSEQLRGTVVLAIPYLGYPAVLLGGQERGAIVAAAGVVVVGYGLVVLVLEAFRSRGKGVPTALGAVIAVLAVMPVAPSPAQAAHTRDPSPTPVSSAFLQLSADGIHFVSDGSIDVFTHAGRLSPGATIDATLWIRNAGPDAARASLRLDARAADGDPGDAEFARTIRLSVDDGVVAAGAEWSSEPLAAGDTVRIAVGVHMDAGADNDTRRATAVVTPVVRLTQEVTPAPGAPDDLAVPDEALPRTGSDGGALATVALLAAAASATGLALRSRPRQPR